MSRPVPGSAAPLTVLVPDDGGVAAFAQVPEVTTLTYSETDGLPHGADAAQVMVVGFGSVERLTSMMRQLPRLRLVQTLHAGVDQWHGRLPAGVLLSNARGAHGPATAEWTMTMLLAIYRGLPGLLADQAAARWRWRTSESLLGKRVLVLGAGDLAGNLRRLLEPFGAEVTLVGRRARAGVVTLADLPVLLPQHDAVVLMLPATRQTRHLVDAAFLARMPEQAVLVNAARGSLVDTDALTAEVCRGRIRAALDVTDPEPLPPEHPLWSAPGVLITPHVAGGVHDYRNRGWQVAVAQVRQFARGHPPDNLVVAEPGS